VRKPELNGETTRRFLSPGLLSLSLGLGRTFLRRGPLPMSLFLTGQWILYRQFAPIAP